MSQHPSYRGRVTRSGTAAAQRPVTVQPAADTATPRYADRACCCRAQPVVIAVMPPSGDRQAETDLLLCGHHYRALKAALAEAGATILDMTGSQLAAGAWPGASG